MSADTQARERAMWTNLLRRDYLDDARWVITEACTTLGHPAKKDKPPEMKSDWERGCVCGRSPFA